jgi:hypothetical protein
MAIKDVRYVTFGADHHHIINGIVYDENCIAVVNGNREKVFKLFGRKFAFEYDPKEWNSEHNKYFPRGFIEVNAS